MFEVLLPRWKNSKPSGRLGRKLGDELVKKPFNSWKITIKETYEHQISDEKIS